MIVINARNVNGALALALQQVEKVGAIRSSRNGTVLAFQEPVSTVYTHPTERVLFSRIRNANPTFHLLESLWMLAGRSDVKFPGTIVKNMKNYTDDGDTFWGAYGHRWRNFFGFDQIEFIIEELRDNPESRRCVLQMWDATFGGLGRVPDLIQGMRGGKDVPCNTCIYFDRRDGNLNMTVCCRSNDILWGCYGANAVHMSVLQEYMALSIGCPVGTYTQMSNDLHLYTATTPDCGIADLALDSISSDAYSAGMVVPGSLWTVGETKEDFDSDLRDFFSAFDLVGLEGVAEEQYETEFFNFTVQPMVRAWTNRKNYREASIASRNIMAPDWRLAMTNWIGGVA